MVKKSRDRQCWRPLFLLLIFLPSCYSYVDRDRDRGLAEKIVKIDSKPTQAMIYINNKKIGETPLKTPISYSGKEDVIITALPLFHRQFKQNIEFTLPAIPSKIVFYMTTPPLETKGRALILDKLPDELDDPVEEIESVPLIVEPLMMPIIYFETDEIEVRSEDKERLLYFSTQLLPLNYQKVILFSFADERGDSVHNKHLSLQRGKAVKAILVEQGVSDDRIVVRGFGSVQSFGDDGKATKLSVNRKVIVVVEKTHEDNSQE